MESVYHKLDFVIRVPLKFPNKKALFIETFSESLATIKQEVVDDVDIAFEKFEIAFKQVFERFAPLSNSKGK